MNNILQNAIEIGETSNKRTIIGDMLTENIAITNINNTLIFI